VGFYLVVFGAAIREDGSPSPTLRRRCENAVNFSRRFMMPYFLATGGAGPRGTTEASVIRTLLLGHGVSTAQILVEAEARDTLESVRLCIRLLPPREEVKGVFVCSSSYHTFRCVLLFRLAGFSADAAPAMSDLQYLGLFKWLRFVLKECVATPWDAVILLLLKVRGVI
jgi:uncharacterized SAM-binding protein YcdF (DUF218 family)